jgi:hypothetical protein
VTVIEGGGEPPPPPATPPQEISVIAPNSPNPNSRNLLHPLY